MKHRIFVIVALLATIGLAKAQSTKQNISSGKVVFEISYPETKLDEKTMAMFPKQSVMYFKDNKSKVEVAMTGGKTVVISDNKAGTATMLMDMMGKKWAIEMTKETIEKQKDDVGKPVVEKTTETKTIAGFLCHKAVVTFKTPEGERKFDVWYTEELKVKNSFSSQIEGIDGFMLEFYAFESGMSMKMTAKSVEPMNVDEKDFIIPADYEKKTLEDLKAMGGR